MTERPLTEAALLRLVRDVGRDARAMQEQAEAIAHQRPSLAVQPGARAALALALHHYYTAFETMISRVLRALEGDLPEGPDWHAALLDDASEPLDPIRPRLISPARLSDLGELRRFRHFLRNAYAVELDPDRLDRLAQMVETLEAALRSDREDLIGFLESLRNQTGS